MHRILTLLALVLALSSPALANVIVSSPASGETLGSPAKFIATANTSCGQGVASIGIYVDDQLVYVVNGTNLNTSLPLSAGPHNAVVQEWDYCGGVTKTAVPITVSDQPGVWVSSPSNNSAVSWLSNYVATATTSCPQGVAAMGIYNNNQLIYIVNGSRINTQLNLSPGVQHTVVQEWDNCGGTTTTPITVTVKGSGNTFYNLQANKGWNSWAQLAPLYQDCSNPCSGVTWAMAQGVSTPSLSGNSTRFDIGGTTPYSDVLWENPLIGQFSTQGLPDTSHTLLPTLHNFTYNADFYLTNANSTQAEEFDINWFMNGVGMTWGTECRIEAGNEWDIWDNTDAKWVPTGIPCNPIDHSWNHVTVNVQRGPNNTLIYESITLNGITHNLNKTYAPFSVPSSWYGITVNYQMDGDYKQAANTTYVDNFSFMYW